MGSGTISLSCSECFSPFPHGTRSLSVSQEYLALPDGPGGFSQDYTCPDLLRKPAGHGRLACTGLSPCIAAISNAFHFYAHAPWPVLLPPPCRDRTGLGWSPVARRYWGNHSCFLLLQVLRCFSSLRSRPTKGRHACSMPGCPIRISADQWSFAPTRGFSQLITSFIASESLGIHHTPLIVCLYIVSRDILRIAARKMSDAYRLLCLLFCFVSFQHVKERTSVTRNGRGGE